MILVTKYCWQSTILVTIVYNLCEGKVTFFCNKLSQSSPLLSQSGKLSPTHFGSNIRHQHRCELMIQELYFFFNRYFMRRLDNLGPLDWFPHSGHMTHFCQHFCDDIFLSTFLCQQNFGNLIFETVVRIDVGLQKGTMLILLWLVFFLDLVFLYFVLFVQSKYFFSTF